MSKAIITEQHLHDIADAIINKGGATAAMTPAQMPAAIQSIPSGGGGESWTKPDLWPDLHAVLAQQLAAHTEYSKAVAVLMLADADETPFTYGSNATSDGAFYTMAATHTWDTSKDIDIGYAKARWFVFFSNENYAWDKVLSPCRPNCLLWVVASDGFAFTSVPGSSYQANLAQCVEADFNVASCHYAFRSWGCLCKIAGNITLTGTNANNAFENCYNLKEVDGTVDLRTASTVNNLFSSCTVLKEIKVLLPQGVNYTTMYQNCVSMEKIDQVDLSGVTNASNFFISARSLKEIDFPLDLHSATNTSAMFRECLSLHSLPDVMDLSASTSTSNMFYLCFSLINIPTHLTCNVSLSFLNSSLIARDCVATFDGSGNINGGLVYNLNVCPNSGQTVSFSSDVKNRFSTEEWTAIKSAMAEKNWGISPA